MTEPKSGLRKFIGNILGILFFCTIAVCLSSLLSFLYSLPTVNPVPPGSLKTVPDMFSKSIEQKMGSGHFHELDAIVYTDVANAPVCLRCHGNFCHNKSEKLRSLVLKTGLGYRLTLTVIL